MKKQPKTKEEKQAEKEKASAMLEDIKGWLCGFPSDLAQYDHRRTVTYKDSVRLATKINKGSSLKAISEAYAALSVFYRAR